MILDRYIARAIFGGTMMSLFVFGALFTFISFVSELQDVGTNNYGTLQALIFVLLNLPQLLYQVFPSAMSVSYTHLTLPTTRQRCRSRWSPYH